MRDIYAALAARIRRALDRLEGGGLSEESAVDVARQLEVDLAEFRKGLRSPDGGGESDPVRREGLRQALQEAVLRFRRAVR